MEIQVLNVNKCVQIPLSINENLKNADYENKLRDQVCDSKE